jgi:acyl carrier protein
VSNDELKALILREVGKIAPEADLDRIDASSSLREQIDLDSMDLLNLMIAIHEATGVEIPEAEYPRMATLSSAVDYLQTRMTC